MDQVSRPLLIALVAVVALFGVWMVVLKPHGSSTSSPAAQPAAPAHPAVPKAPASRAPVAPAHPVARRPVRPAHPVARPVAKLNANAAFTAVAARISTAQASAHRALPATRSVTVPTRAGRLSAVERALASRKVVALLFYNPSAADDQAVKQELATVPSHGGRVFKLAIPLGELSSYTQVTSQVPVNISPTLVIIDRARSAQAIAGFADSFEISQRLQDALSVRARLR